MEGLNRITFFKSYWDFIEQMSSIEDKFSLVEGICKYAFYGEKPEMTPAAAAAFVLILPYLEKSMRRAASGKIGGKAKPKETESKPASKPVSKPASKRDTKEERRKTKEEAERHKYGEYGWVLLSDEQYQKLLGELGEEELKRCIRYVDESAQKTGNKNGWKDWNLVIRACHRDGWANRAERRSSGGFSRVPAATQKQEDEWNIVYD